MAARSTPAKSRQNTRDRILENSLRLFNQRGVEKVSALDISKALSISPGNLTYHFKKKQDIVDALVEALEQDLLTALEDIDTIGALAQDHQQWVNRLFGLLWQYRFFFNDITYLGLNAPKLKKKYGFFKNSSTGKMRDNYKRLEQAGLMNPIVAPNTVELLVDNIWYLWLSYVRIYAFEVGSRKCSQEGFINFASRHNMALMFSHYTDEVKQGLNLDPLEATESEEEPA
ncbi:TetR/AcrR family transcriptional regulator [Pseudomaricurvus alkylphenolicus]|uniref:TetR/AcrR family transcriptional regulator n=1 Tax=Pseudomaricurvus alkylphenolicus TaxID=1306991 RepID=UPI00142287FC|nr:TetR/AcrR family transcriptional regulator [Pseudomaricurvus alkylphenolicus]NIB38818.1 TetR/AcrR family transcriptional regulator [Pseudomaricurvus alkylphenolicus]